MMNEAKVHNPGLTRRANPQSMYPGEVVVTKDNYDYLQAARTEIEKLSQEAEEQWQVLCEMRSNIGYHNPVLPEGRKAYAEITAQAHRYIDCIDNLRTAIFGIPRDVK